MGRSIYSYSEEELLSKEELEDVLSHGLVGASLYGLPLRTRSKVLKTLVCQALGYDVPSSFPKIKPKFPCQQFDIYAQKSNNLQIWNDEISESRRYVLIRLNELDTITQVKVIDGFELKMLDTTGKLTIKYQARVPQAYLGERISEDNFFLRPFVNDEIGWLGLSPNDPPRSETLISINALYSTLKPLIGIRIRTENLVQERTTADDAHELVCRTLGYRTFQDDGQFPDIVNQLLEVKLQMSPTIDLGLHKPDDETSTGLFIEGTEIKICMCRYLVLIAHRIDEKEVEIDDLFITSGDHFFDVFTLFGGKVQNAKLQIPLPSDFWD